MKNFSLNNYRSPLLIAEVGINHNGNTELAKKTIKEASIAGADLVKLQLFKAKSLCSETSKYFKIFKKCELSEKQVDEIYTYANKNNISLFSTAFDEWAVNVCIRQNAKLIKIASGDITNIPLIRFIAKKKIPIILSTGASSMSDINEAIKAIKKESKALKIYILHCVSNYPTEAKDANLNCMKTIKNKFKVPVGFSDHTASDFVSITAVALGAQIIEKHFTCDKKLPGPDHSLSLSPKEFLDFSYKLKQINVSLGVFKKNVVEGRKLQQQIRRGLYAAVSLKKGNKISPEDIVISRPEIGINIKYYSEVIGSILKKSIKKGTALKWEYFHKK